MSAASAESRAGPDSAALSDIVELDVRPAGRSVLLFARGWLFLAVAWWMVGWTVVVLGWFPDLQAWLLLGPIALLLIVLVIAAIIRNSFRFQLSSRRVNAAWGVFSRAAVEARVEDIRNVAIGRSLLQRLLGLGSIEMTTAGVGPQVIWVHVLRPADLAEQIRRSIDAARAKPLAESWAAAGPIQPPVFPTQPDKPSSSRRLPVIGLVGGIGAGKSTVAAAFARHGCFVIDSDARAKAALDRADVRDSLVEWWGSDVLSPEGRIDRSKVAAIVFTDPAQRQRLEQLVHPIVREDRAGMIREALAAGARAAIVDAPLLFEAGVDAECDTVVFVHAPREQRLQRVRQSRNWDEAEFDRREASQLSVEEKRRRSGHIVENSGKIGGIDSQVVGILAEVAPGT